MSHNERTGFRDEALSRRHREYGYDCPAVDLDFPLIEYSKGKAVALIEHKYHLADRADIRTSPSIEALRGLADGSNIPFLVVYYWRDPFSYEVHAGNNVAIKYREERGKKHPIKQMSELDYVYMLHDLRGRALPENIKVILSTTKPPEVKEPLQTD